MKIAQLIRILVTTMADYGNVEVLVECTTGTKGKRVVVLPNEVGPCVVSDRVSDVTKIVITTKPPK